MAEVWLHADVIGPFVAVLCATTGLVWVHAGHRYDSPVSTALPVCPC